MSIIDRNLPFKTGYIVRDDKIISSLLFASSSLSSLSHLLITHLRIVDRRISLQQQYKRLALQKTKDSILKLVILIPQANCFMRNNFKRRMAAPFPVQMQRRGQHPDFHVRAGGIRVQLPDFSSISYHPSTTVNRLPIWLYH